MDVFLPFGGLHAVTLVTCAPLIAAPTLFGRASTRTAKALRRTLAALAVGYWLAYNIWWNWHGIDLAQRVTAANLRLQRPDCAIRFVDGPALGARDIVFLDQRR